MQTAGSEPGSFSTAIFSTPQATVSGHLENHQDNGDPAAEETKEIEEEVVDEIKEELPLSSTDYELYEALNVLKGLALFKK